MSKISQVVRQLYLYPASLPQGFTIRDLWVTYNIRQVCALI